MTVDVSVPHTDPSQNIVAARIYFARAQAMLRQATTDAEIATARGWMTNASDEIARWTQALEADDA